jgi:dihydrofolate reductase
VEWQNSRIASGSIADEVARMKQVPGDGVLPVGGSDLAASFLEQGLIDELHVILTPILLGGGKTVFDGIKKRYPLRLLSTKEFKSGNVVVIYEPALR